MKCSFPWFAVGLCSLSIVFAADAPPAAELPKDLQESLDLIKSRVEDLRLDSDDHRKALEASNRKVAELQAEVEQLKVATTTATAKWVMLSNLLETVNLIQEKFEKQRESDRQTFLEAIADLQAKLLAPPVVAITNAAGPPELTSGTNAVPLLEQQGKTIEYVVMKGDSVGVIVKAHNEKFKTMGLLSITIDDVVNANPGMNRDNIREGAKIRIPVKP